MKQLSNERFGRAKEFLLREARNLERTLFRLHFDGGARDKAMAALAEYQNADGGFGHALEADVRLPDSSPYATEVGLAILGDIGCTTDEAMVKRAVEYLFAQYDKDTLTWNMLPEAAQDYPRAPWWNDRRSDGPFKNLQETFDGFAIIPRVHLVDLLYQFHAEAAVPDTAALVDDTLRAIGEAKAGDLGGGGIALRSCVEFISNERIIHPAKERVEEHLREIIPQAVSLDQSQWNTYCAAPLNIFPSPSPFAEGVVAEAVEQHLDFLLDTQTEEGYWDPTWTWMGWYPDAWYVAQKEWRGVITLENLRKLQTYGRLG